MSRTYNLLGRTFGYITVHEQCHNPIQNKVFWRCTCICGRSVYWPSNKVLSSSRIQTCGRCQDSLHHPELYNQWIYMKQWCYNMASKYYDSIGALGIQVCPEWKLDFKRVLADLGDPPQDGKRYRVVRLRLDEDYGPDNCKWELSSQQVGSWMAGSLTPAQPPKQWEHVS